MTVKTIVRRYAPRGAARTLFTCKAGEVLVSGPAGTGKSRACLEKLLLQMLKYDGARGLIVRKSALSLTSTTLVTWREHVAKEALRAGVVWFYGGSAEQAAQYRFTNGSTITIGGLDKPEKIMSSEYDVAYAGEATELAIADWEAITTRLRNGVMPYQQLIADCNPQAEHHWLKQRCNGGQTLMLESRHADNPIYVNDDGTYTERGQSYIVEVLGKLTGVRKLRLADGKWVSAEGLVYEGYDPAVHVVDRFPIPDTWPRIWSVDFGYVNPLVCQWWAIDPDGRAWLYREIYRTQRLVEDHAKDMLAAVTDKHGNWTEPKPTRIVCDHDAEGRATLERHLGMSTVPAHKAVTEGIQAVQARMAPAGDGRPRIGLLRDSVVSRDDALATALKPTQTAEELSGYVWDTGVGRAPKEAPLKVDDHGCDAMRYLVANLDLSPRPAFRGWI